MTAVTVHEPDTFPTFIDSNLRADFVSCPQSFFRRYIQNLRLEGPAPHLHFGGVFAKGLEQFRIAFYEKGMSAREAMRIGAETIIRRWGGEENDPPEGHNKTLAACLDAFLSYLIQYPPETDPVRPWITPEGKAAVEFTFALPIPDILHPVTQEPIIYCGRFDQLALFQNALFVEDDKTTSRLGDSWNNNWRLRSQLTGYMWGAKEYGHKIAGCIIRGVSILKRDIGHAQVIEQRPEWMIDRWLEQLQRDMRRMISCWNEGYWDFALDEACTRYGGCPFLTLCTSPNPERWIPVHYRTEKWDPLASDDT